MVLSKAVYHLGKAHNATSGEDARLTHAATKSLAPPSGGFDEVRLAAEHSDRVRADFAAKMRTSRFAALVRTAMRIARYVVPHTTQTMTNAV